RQRIDDAGSFDADTIRFASNVVGTVTLTTGELAFAKTLTISGPGAKVLALSGNSSNRVFHVKGGSVLLSGLTITNGRNTVSSYGGGILNDAAATLTVSNCAVLGNTAFTIGGGIANLG